MNKHYVDENDATEEFMKVTLHEVLKKMLKDKNLSKVARELDIPKQRLHDWIHAKKTPSFKNANELKKLAHYLGLSFEELVFGVENQRSIFSTTLEDEKRLYLIKIERLK